MAQSKLDDGYAPGPGEVTVTLLGQQKSPGHHLTGAVFCKK